MKDKTAFKIAISAIEYKRRKVTPQYYAYKSGYRAPSIDNAYKQYERYTTAIGILEDYLEGAEEPEPEPQLRLDV